MKVDLNAITLSGINQTQDNNKAERTSTNSLAAPDQDKATLSTDKATVEQLTSQALGFGEMRQDKIQALRQALQSGEYKVDAQKIADAMIQEAS